MVCKCANYSYLLAFLLLSQLCGAKLQPGKWQIFNITCDPNSIISPRECTSDTLETIAANVATETNINVRINILTPLLLLNANISFSNLSSLIIIGVHNNIAEISCNSDVNSSAGIVISNITQNVTLRHLKLTYCGSQTISIYSRKIFSSALRMVKCKNVEVHQITIERSRGIGLSILFHLGGTVIIASSIFKENKLPREYTESNSVWGGGGIYINVNMDQQLPITFHIDNCTFENNTSHTLKNELDFTSALSKPEVGYGRGGGVFVSIKGGMKRVNVIFSNCRFLVNKAYIGGGLSVVQKINKQHTNGSEKILNNVSVEVRDSVFENNGCNDGLHYHTWSYYGGGAHFLITGSVMSNSHYLLKNVTFDRNCAQVGGATSYYSQCPYLHQSGEMTRNAVIFNDCLFTRNQGHLGAAVEISPNYLSLSSESCTVPSVFKNCKFIENEILLSYVNNTEKQRTYGLGIIFASKQNLHFEGSNQFQSNIGSAIYLISSLANFEKSNVSFVNNTGICGGAIVLIGESLMIVGPNNYYFINNTALHQGGAVYVRLIDNMDFASLKSKQCFIENGNNNVDLATSLSGWGSNIIFAGNKAVDDTAGHSIYATSLTSCQIINNGSKDETHYILVQNISEVFSVRGFRFCDDSIRPQIATDGALFHTSRPTPLMIIPGEMFKHGVTITDDLGQTVHATLRVTIGENNTSCVQLSSGYSQYIDDVIQLHGKPHHSALLHIFTVLSARQSFIKLEVDLLDCPPGFNLTDTLVCACNIDAYKGFYKCDSKRFRSYLHQGYWAGLLKTKDGTGEELVTATCPYCDYYHSHSNKTHLEFGIALPQNSSKLSEAVCGETRTGVLCGKCQEGYTVHFHSPGFLCKPAEPHGCKLGWLFYILSELLPVTIIFITVLVLNISFTSGAVNGFILFSQLLDTWSIEAHGIIVLPESVIYNWIQGYQVIYGFFNIEFFTSESLSFCLWKDASTLDVLSVKYITILYSLLLIVVVIWVMNNCGNNWPCRYYRITTMRTSVIHGISTFLVMCYAQCLRASLFLLTPAYFFPEESSTFSPLPRVWLNGELMYFSKEHLPYALPALFCLLTVNLLPPVLLVTYPLLNKVMAVFGCEDIKVVKLVSRIIPLSSLKPLLDSIQGCFKDNMRFFAGFYFFYRWTILLFHMRADNFSVYYTTVSGFLLFILTLHAICQPYIKRAHNIIDTLLFANLVLVNFLSFFNYHRSRGKLISEHWATVTPSVVQLVLIYFPLIVMSVYILLMLCKKLECKSFLVRASAFFIPQRAMGLREIVQNFSSNDEDSDTNWDDFVHDRLLNNSTHYPKY